MLERLDVFFHKIAQHERMLVYEPWRVRRRIIVELIIFVVTIVCWLLYSHLIGTLLGALCSVVVGLAIGRTAMMGFRRASAYRGGWLDGRSALLRSMSEAAHRGMSLEEWASAELARDLAVMGVHIEHLDEDDDEPR